MSGTVTVTKESWDLHQRALRLLNTMADHPDKGVEFKRLAKAVDGTLQFTDLDMADRIQKPLEEKLTATEAALAKINEEREAEKLAKQQTETVSALNADVDGAVKKFGLTDDGRKKMTERMQEKGNLDAEAAAAWVASQTPKARPEGVGSFAPSALNLYGSAEKDDNFAALHQDPQRWQDAEISRMLQEGLTDA
jgi:hypothetical protein